MEDDKRAILAPIENSPFTFYQKKELITSLQVSHQHNSRKGI